MEEDESSSEELLQDDQCSIQLTDGQRLPNSLPVTHPPKVGTCAKVFLTFCLCASFFGLVSEVQKEKQYSFFVFRNCSWHWYKLLGHYAKGARTDIL